MYQTEKQTIIDTAKLMDRYGLICLSGGNICVRVAENSFLITPSAIRYDDMVADDIVLINETGEILEGNRRPSSDMFALLYIFKQMPHINATIHTHQPYATAAGLLTDEIPAFLTTIIDANNGPVKVAPFTISSDEGMGIESVKYIGNSLAVILKHHGVMAIGKDLDEALESALYLEDAAKIYLLTRSVGPIPTLSNEQIAQEGAERGNYGQ